MDDATLSLAREWFAKAASDLASARKLAAEPDPILDTAIYHCQQAADVGPPLAARQIGANA